MFGTCHVSLHSVLSIYVDFLLRFFLIALKFYHCCTVSFALNRYRLLDSTQITSKNSTIDDRAYRTVSELIHVSVTKCTISLLLVVISLDIQPPLGHLSI